MDRGLIMSAKAPSINEAKKSMTNPKAPAKTKLAVHDNKAVDKVVAPSTAYDLSPDGTVSWKIIGAGGAGKSAALRFRQNNTTTPIITIDTSGTTDEIPGVEVIRLKDLNGSGKLRRNNATQITEFVSDYTNKVEWGDVNVVICSFAGGSGSVVGPRLAREILRQGKIVIVIGIIDTDSEVDTMNSLDTLKSFNAVAAQHYVPTILFNNSNGQPMVDNGIDLITSYIAEIMDTQYVGLDREDRLRFLNPDSFNNVTPGLRMMNLSKDPEGHWENIGIVTDDVSHDILDATLILSTIDKHMTLETHCTVTYRGYSNDDIDTLVASIGYRVPQSLVASLHQRCADFQALQRPDETKFGLSNDDDDLFL